MANFEFTWAILTGLLSIFAVIPGCLIYIYSQLPSQKLRPMFESLKEADELLLSCVEGGLVYGTSAETYRATLDALHMRAEDARFEVHAARTYADDFANWVKGLSRQIADICWQVRDVRADISSNSLRERERQASLRQRATAGNGDYQPVSSDDTSSTPFVLDDNVSVGGMSDHADGILSVQALTPQPDIAPSIQTAMAPSSQPGDASSNVTADADELQKHLSLSMATPLTVESPRKPGHNDRRRSASSGSSGASSLQSMRRKKRGGDPLSRARTMARFVRQARAIHQPPVFIVDPIHFAALDLVESDDDSDDEWIDEQAIRIVA